MGRNYFDRTNITIQADIWSWKNVPIPKRTLKKRRKLLFLLYFEVLACTLKVFAMESFLKSQKFTCFVLRNRMHISTVKMEVIRKNWCNFTDCFLHLIFIFPCLQHKFENFCRSKCAFWITTIKDFIFFLLCFEKKKKLNYTDVEFDETTGKWKSTKCILDFKCDTGVYTDPLTCAESLNTFCSILGFDLVNPNVVSF